MTANTEYAKIDKVLSKITGKELKDFVRLYACTHDEFALALIEKYWKPERGNYKEMVEACFAHADILGKKYNQPQLDWDKIEEDLQPIMRKVVTMRRKGNLIDASLIAGYVLTITCREFENDHRNCLQQMYSEAWAEEKKGLKAIVHQAADTVKDLLILSDEIEEDSRLGMLREIIEQCEEIGDNFFIKLTWFVDEAMPILCADDEKAYMAFISKRMKKEMKYFRFRYVIQKADYLIAHGKKAKAIKVLTDKLDDEHVMEHYVDCLMDWGEYEKALEVIDTDKDEFRSYMPTWNEKVISILKKSGNRQWLIDECSQHFITNKYKMLFYTALKEAVDKKEWKDFLAHLWEKTDWEYDINDAEAKISIAEKKLEWLKMFFVHQDYDVMEHYRKYGKYIPKKDQAFVGEILSKEIKRLALLKEKPKEFNWLLAEIDSLFGISTIVDEVIKKNVKKLIEDYPDRQYFDSYLGSIFRK